MGETLDYLNSLEEDGNFDGEFIYVEEEPNEEWGASNLVCENALEDLENMAQDLVPPDSVDLDEFLTHYVKSAQSFIRYAEKYKGKQWTPLRLKRLGKKAKYVGANAIILLSIWAD